MDKIEQLLLSECIYKVLMASGVVTSSDACDLSGAIEAAVLEAQKQKQEPWPFSADRARFREASRRPVGCEWEGGREMSKLSDEKIDEIARDYKAILLGGNPYFPWFDFARAIIAAVFEAQGTQEPVAWAYTINNSHSVFSAEKPPEDAYDEGTLYPLYAAPIVQPDMVMVPREATEAMLDAAMNRYKHVSPEAKARYTQMHRENFRCDYRAMIAAAEGKSNARLTVAEPVGRASDSTRKLDIGD